MLRFRDTGVAFAHFSLPHHRVPWIDLASEVDRAIASAQVEVESRTLEYTVGPTDLLVRLNIRNFRPLSLLQGRILSAWAERSTWVFAVPFVGKSGAAPVTPGPGDISYLLHVRVRRDVYREGGGVRVDEAIVEAAQEFAEQAGISLEVLAGLGWSDLIFAGSFSCDIETFLAFVLRVQALGGAEHPTPVIDRVLTVLSFSMEFADYPERNHAAVRPLAYVRADAGRFVEAADLFSSPTGTDDLPMLFALEGKWDFVVLPKAGSVTNLPSHLIDLLKSFTSSVQRIETHVLALNPGAAMEALRGGTPFRLNIASPKSTVEDRRCGCSLDGLPMEALKLLSAMDRSIVPRRLRVTLENVLMLLRYALREPMNCCDTYPGVRACVASFIALLQEMQVHGECLKTLDAHQASLSGGLNQKADSDPKRVSELLNVNEKIGHLHDVLEQQRELLEIWCQTSERSLSERTAGSFEDLFGRTDRLSTYRGGLQKLLFLADCLLDEFCCLAALPFEESMPGKFSLGTLCEPISTLRSIPALGIVEIPARDRFSLALIVPQLWHEVGQYLFRRRYPLHTSLIIEQRLQNQAERIEEIAVGKRLNVSPEPSPLIPFSVDARRELRQQVFDQDFSLRDLGDMYADLIVFHYGFREDWSNFASYLTDVVADAASHEEMPAVVWWRQCTTLALRLFHVATFGCLRLKLKEDQFAELASAEEAVFRETMHHVMSDSGFVFELASNAVSAIETILQAKRYEVLLHRLPPDIQSTINFNVEKSTELNYFRLEFIIDLLYQLRGVESPALEVATESVELLEVGEILDLEATVGEISALFHAQFIGALSERRSRDSSQGVPLSAQAALGRSATLAFMRRQNSNFSAPGSA